jgi:hypothetical protein
MTSPRRRKFRNHSSSSSAAPRPVPSLVGVAAAFCVALAGCGNDVKSDGDDGGEVGSDEHDSETGGEQERAPELLGDPQIIFHPNQPMVVDVIVELDRAGSVELSHDSDPGVKVASLAIEDEGRRHHLRVRGLRPHANHAFTLTLEDLDGQTPGATHPLSFTTNLQQPGFRPTFEVEVPQPEALDPAYRMFDYTYAPLWEPAGIFVIDVQGITRWYFNGGPPVFPGATTIWAGVEMLDDGSILAVRDGAVTVIDELGEVRLRFLSFDYGLSAFHHEAHMMGNGNYLTLGNKFEYADYSSLGLDEDTLVAGDLLVEFNPEGEIVWMWNSFDHMDPLRVRSDPHEGLAYFDPATGQFGYDWTHGNGMVHTAHDDVILLSMRHQDWIIAIDHQTDEILWRLGEEGDFELLSGTWFYHQHSPQWQPDGTLLLYDNAVGNPDVPYAELVSRAVRYALDFDAMTATQVWDSVHGEPVISSVGSDADRTPAGNVLVLDSALQPDPLAFDIGKNFARLVEHHYEGDTSPIWSLVTNPGCFVYRATAIDRLPGE